MGRRNVLSFGVAILILSLVCAVPVCDAKVKSGDLDISFGTSGTVTTDFGGGERWPTPSPSTAHGKIVVAGVR